MIHLNNANRRVSGQLVFATNLFLSCSFVSHLVVLNRRLAASLTVASKISTLIYLLVTIGNCVDELRIATTCANRTLTELNKVHTVNYET